MSTTVTYRYDAVRYSPIHSELHPFQIVSSCRTFGSSLPETVVVELSVTEAIDLHHSLGAMILGVTDHE